jgi:tetratricopeptide (TPR) repeat protein
LAYRFVDDEIANVRAAFRWAVDHDRADAAIRIAACVHPAARMRLRTETFGWAAEVADLARRLEHRKLPLLLTMAADSAWGLGLLDDAKRYGHEAIALADNPRFEPIVWAYADLAQIALFQGDVEASLELLRTGAAHPADRRDRVNLAYLIFVGGAVGQQLPDDELAQAMTQINEAGFPMAIALGLSGRAAYLAQHDAAAAIELYQQVIDLLESCGDRLLEQFSRAQLVSLLANADDPDLALGGFADTVNAWRINGDTVLAVGIGQLVVLLVRLGHLHGAVQLYGATTRSVVLDTFVPELKATIAAAREAIGNDAFRSAYDTGAALSYQAAADLACELITSARAQLTSTA